MSSSAWTVVGLLLAIAAVILLVRRLRQGEPGSRWLVVTAAAWGAAFAAQAAGADTVTPVVQLTLTDLLALFGLPALGLAFLRLARAGQGETSAGVEGLGPDSGQLTDGCLLALSVFTVGWIALFRHAYIASGVGAGAFTVDLIHPVADLALLGGSLWLAVRAGRRALTPYLALCAATVGDFIAVQARASGTPPGSWAQIAWIVGIALLGARGLEASAAPSQQKALTATAAPEPPLSTVIGLAAAGAAAVVSLIFGSLTLGHIRTVPVLLGGGLVLVIIARIGGLLRQAAASSALAEQASGQFYQLA
ncbi:MAG TPA: hypothetical protein VKB62_09870, partial [Streptosporangiaceae bacterium]|nr:hypothetical protein [Streptosporangiaceae bacterium]